MAHGPLIWKECIVIQGMAFGSNKFHLPVGFQNEQDYPSPAVVFCILLHKLCSYKGQSSAKRCTYDFNIHLGDHS